MSKNLKEFERIKIISFFQFLNYICLKIFHIFVSVLHGFFWKKISGLNKSFNFQFLFFHKRSFEISKIFGRFKIGILEFLIYFLMYFRISKSQKYLEDLKLEFWHKKFVKTNAVQKIAFWHKKFVRLIALQKSN